MEEKRQAIVYESLHIICFKCGRYGHTIKNCIIRKKGEESNEGLGREEVGYRSKGCERGGRKGVMGVRKMLINPGSCNEDLACVNLGDDTFGRWMVSEERRRFQARFQSKTQSKIGRSLQGKNGGKFTVSNNSFAVLEDKEMEKEEENKSEGSIRELGKKIVDMLCLVMAGEIEMRATEVRLREDEEEDNEVVDEEIMIDEEPSREVCSVFGGGELVVGGGESVGGEFVVVVSP